MNEAPLFSVVIPNYNYGKYLPRAIESVLSQTDVQFEVIVVDDGSRDNSLEVLSPYASRVKIIPQQNSGVSVARNRGVAESTGEYIYFLDADDELLPQALKNFQSCLEKNPQAGVFIAHHISVDEHGKEHPGKEQPFFKDRQKTFCDFLRRQFGIVHGSVVFRRDVFDILHYPPGVTNGEDLVVFAQAMALFDTVRVPFATARIHAHAGRARDNLPAIRKTGYSTVDLLFNAEILPPEFMKYRNHFLARKALSLGRVFLKAGANSEAREAYGLVWKTQHSLLFNPTHFFRMVRSWLKR